VKTTLDVPNDILRSAKAAAALRGETLGVYVTAAIEARLRADKSIDDRSGWRRVFGRARRADVAAVDRIISRDLEKIDLTD